MSRRCAITEKGGLSGNTVSHSNRKAKRRFMPNMTQVSLQSSWPHPSFTGQFLPIEHQVGVSGFTAFNALMYLAAYSTTAINIGILQGSIPVFVLIGAFIAYRTPIGPVQALGVLVTLLGVAVVASRGELAVLRQFAFAPGDQIRRAQRSVFADKLLGRRSIDLPRQAFDLATREIGCGFQILEIWRQARFQPMVDCADEPVRHFDNGFGEPDRTFGHQCGHILQPLHLCHFGCGFENGVAEDRRRIDKPVCIFVRSKPRKCGPACRKQAAAKNACRPPDLDVGCLGARSHQAHRKKPLTMPVSENHFPFARQDNPELRDVSALKIFENSFVSLKKIIGRHKRSKFRWRRQIL